MKQSDLSSIKICQSSKNSTTHNMKGRKDSTDDRRDKDNINKQAQIWTVMDQTKVSTQHQQCEHATDFAIYDDCCTLTDFIPIPR